MALRHPFRRRTLHEGDPRTCAASRHSNNALGTLDVLLVRDVEAHARIGKSYWCATNDGTEFERGGNRLEVDPSNLWLQVSRYTFYANSKNSTFALLLHKDHT